MDSISNIGQSLYNQTYNNKMGSSYSKELDGNTYMTLFINGLLNQNPMEPMSNGEMMQQMSQLTMVETVNKLQTTTEKLLGSQNLNPLMIFGDIIGKNVMVHNQKGKIEGTVLSVGSQGDRIMFEMDNGNVYSVTDIVGISELPSEEQVSEDPVEPEADVETNE